MAEEASLHRTYTNHLITQMAKCVEVSHVFGVVPGGTWWYLVVHVVVLHHHYLVQSFAWIDFPFGVVN